MSAFSICPYPGLRPFNEEESIFFKGREEHIEQIIKQLEEKKFLMLTGASGDGKSSLVYAGLIPNARAGFFKAKFNNWIIADFRPEREPLSNFAQSLFQHLKTESVEKTEKELSYGFSALLDIYKASPYWIDTNAAEYKALPEADQKKTKRKGANLMILVDQFEEFFTNPENYSSGKSSDESQTVVNLLLETTRLAIEQDIPIYIVCTMRSDYIGQCASFRGLPEYIGYSQFFVPRLKRKEIYQVIEEPALLNGNKISKRLVEMLINEMNDGIDQLPVLQHALNQIWQMADSGNNEMDFIHFAKVSGLPKNQLTKEDKQEFESWFETLPDFKKNYFNSASLENVLDAHANALFELAAEYANTIAKKDLVTASEAKFIIEVTFKCLTKIDAARAVRNRMTLEEVTNIINRPNISQDVVAAVLEVFRKQGNTFLKPFIIHEEDSAKLNANSVLDITHESLIRNWKRLTEWANEEYESLLTYQDFDKQLQRWLQSGKSSGYLLPIGPLTFFENWYKQAKPNKYWIARYDERELSKEEKLKDAEQKLADIKSFIKRSARSLFFSRTVIKYGANNIIAVFGILVLLFSCTYFYFDFRKKQNDYVVEEIQGKSKKLLQSKFIKNKVKADYILVAERLNPGTFKKLLNYVEGDSAQIEVVREMFSSCLSYQENKEDDEPDNPLVGKLFLEQLNIIESKNVFNTNSSFVKNINNLLVTIYGHIILKRNNFDVNDNGSYQKFCNKTFLTFINLIKDTSAIKKIDVEQFNKLLHVIPEITNYDTIKLKEVIILMNPFLNTSKRTFDILYPKDKTIKQNWNDYITHNGGYYELANLFSLTNNFDYLNKSFDSLLFYNKNFINSSDDYERFLYNLIITNKLFTKDGADFLSKIETKITVKSSFSLDILMLNNLLNDKIDIQAYLITNLTSKYSSAFDFQLQKEHIDYNQVNDLSENIISRMLNNKNLNNDDKFFLAAILYKAKAFANNKKVNYKEEILNNGLKKSLYYYNRIKSEYLRGDISLGKGNSVKLVTRSKLYKFGASISLSDGWSPFSLSYWDFKNLENKSAFINFLINEKGLNEFFFKYDDDALILNEYLISYFASFDFKKKNEDIINLNPFEAAILKNNLSSKIDKNALFSFLACYYYYKNDLSKALMYSKQINYKELLDKEKINKEDNSYKYYNLANSTLNFYWNQPYIYDTTINNKTSAFTNGFELLNSFPDEFQKRNALVRNIDSLQRKGKDDIALVLLDTLINSKVLKYYKFGNKLFEILGRLSTNSGDKIAMLLMKDKSDKNKPNCLKYFISGKAQSGNYYQAITFIPDYVSSSSQLSLFTTILKHEIIKRKQKQLDGWSSMDNSSENWSSFPFEESENENVFYSSSE